MFLLRAAEHQESSWSVLKGMRSHHSKERQQEKVPKKKTIAKFLIQGRKLPCWICLPLLTLTINLIFGAPLIQYLGSIGRDLLLFWQENRWVFLICYGTFPLSSWSTSEGCRIWETEYKKPRKTCTDMITCWKHAVWACVCTPGLVCFCVGEELHLCLSPNICFINGSSVGFTKTILLCDLQNASPWSFLVEEQRCTTIISWAKNHRWKKKEVLYFRSKIVFL